MNYLIVLILGTYANFAVAQLSDIQIFNSDSQKVRFRVLTNDHACLLFDQIEYSECELVKIEKSRDTMFLTQSLEYLRSEPLVFLSSSYLFGDSILIETFFKHPFMEGHAIIDELYYELDNIKYVPNRQNSDEFKHQLIVKRPVGSQFELSVYNDSGLLGHHSIKLNESQNLIHIEHSDIFTNTFYPPDYDTIFPCSVLIDGKPFVLVYLE